MEENFKKKTFYFSHDLNARNDTKILAMRVDYGDKGYGRYWMIVETLAEASGYKLKLNKENIKGIALSLNIPAKQLAKFINDCIEKYHLFAKDENGEYFWSETLQRRMKLRDDITDKLVEAGRKGAKKRWGNHNNPNGEAIDLAKEKKPYLENVYLTDDELKRLENNYGKNITEDYIEKLNRYIVEHILSGERKPYVSHYLTIRAWVRKDQKDKLLESGSFSNGKGDSYVNLRELKKGKKDKGVEK